MTKKIAANATLIYKNQLATVKLPRKFDELNKKYEGALKKLKEDAYKNGSKEVSSYHYKKH